MMKNRSLSFKLITGGILVVLIPMLVIGLFSIQKASNALESLAKEQAVNLAKDLANMTQLVLQEEVKLVNDLSITHTIMNAARSVSETDAAEATSMIAQLNGMLARAMKERGDDYESILVTDENGKVFADGDHGEHQGISLKDRVYFQSAIQGQTSVSTPVKSKLTGKPIVPICAPIRSDDGKVLGTVTNVMKMDFLSEKIVSVKVGETGYPFLVDKTGLAVAHPNEKHVMNTNLARLDGMETIMGKMLAHQTGVESYVFEGIRKIAGYAPVKLTGWSIGVTQPEDEFLGAAYAIRNVILLVGGLFLAVTLFMVLFFARSLSKPIDRIIEGLNEGSDQVASASAQVSAASQSLAEGASEQAASIEETSSSLEEISSMTKQNAEHAAQANSLMEESKHIVSSANASMTEMVSSMQEISKASDETSKIIKTIDEIAFQTNLLALNAAVEAARAGEAGAGFAVVADEVRNLALRAAEAAKNTATLIEDTTKKVEDGSALVEKTNDEFSRVEQSAMKVAELVGEIAAASKEQSDGVDQVNIAVADMDKVVQQNAANAEESASASEEMNAQAEQMKGMVDDLVVLVRGAVNHHQRRSRIPGLQKGSGETALPHHRELHLQAKPVNSPAHMSGHEVSPEAAIPLEDHESFKDF